MQESQTPNDYIKLNRKLRSWGWYKDYKTCHLFIHMLLSANWKPGKFKGIDIERGQFASSFANLSADTGLTVNEVRTAIKHLELTNELTSKSHVKFSVFTVVKYNEYQSLNKQTTTESQPFNDDLTTIEEVKKERSKEVKIKRVCGAYKHVRLTDGEREELVKDLGDDMTEKAIAFLDEYIEMKGYKAKSHYLCIRKWVVDAVNEHRVKVDKPKGANKFNNFTQRNYDFDELEKSLIGNNKGV